MNYRRAQARHTERIDFMRISYECQDLINELAQDIFEFGDFEVYVWFKNICGTIIYTNYDFMENPIQPEEIGEGEEITTMKATKLLNLLIKQNKIL